MDRRRGAGPGAGLIAGRLGAAALALSLLPACPTEPKAGACAGQGGLGLVARPNRLDTDPIEDGAPLPVFPPPQGGVFTELDVNIAGVRAEDLLALRVRVDDRSGATLAIQEYNGAGLPLMCEDDDTLLVLGLPVGFSLMTDLAALDGVEATLHLGIETPTDSLDETWEVVLTVTS